MKPMATAVVTPSPGTSSIHPLICIPARRFFARTFDEVEALVIPEQITANATRNVKKWMPNALCVYSAAPAAWGYLVTSSR